MTRSGQTARKIACQREPVGLRASDLQTDGHSSSGSPVDGSSTSSRHGSLTLLIVKSRRDAQAAVRFSPFERLVPVREWDRHKTRTSVRIQS
ncbi:hypothetical protein, partial [Azospirillum doebereinerae]|uniref:hypothetical protein n=1 Tax=Azospirillum doebereinerae TaxID=92933 RepID=UPI001B3B8ABD